MERKKEKKIVIRERENGGEENEERWREEDSEDRYRERNREGRKLERKRRKRKKKQCIQVYDPRKEMSFEWRKILEKRKLNKNGKSRR